MSIDKSAISEVSLLTEQDLYLFNEGSHLRLYEKLGAHPIALEGNLGTYFAVFAPNAKACSNARTRDNARGLGLLEASSHASYS